MDFLIVLTILLFLVYVAVYVIYFFLVSFLSKNRKSFVRNGRYNTSNYYNNFVVIIYSHNNENEVSNLLEILNRQKYPKENYKIYVILDNCTDNSSNRLETIGGANIFRVGDSYTVGKDESVSQLLDRLIAYRNINAYVFLNANRSVDEYFLNSVNHGLMNHDVLTASTVLLGEPKTLKEKIVDAYNTYENNILNTSRSMLGLSCLINSDCCVIKQKVIEKVQCIDFKDVNSELKYSVMLAKLNYKTSFDPNIKTFLNRELYSIRKPSFSYRITLLKNSLPMFLKSSFLFNEFVLSSIQPSVIVLFMLFALLTLVTYFGRIDSKILYSILAVMSVSFLFSLLNSKLKLKQIVLYLFLYPIYSLLLLIRKLPIIKQICDFIDERKNPKHYEKKSFPVTVSAGDKKMKCTISLLEEDGMIRGIFKFKSVLPIYRKESQRIENHVIITLFSLFRPLCYISVIFLHHFIHARIKFF